MSILRIERAVLADLPRIKEIGDNVSEFAPSRTGCFWPLEALQKWCENRDDLMLVARDDEKIVGFALFAGHWPTHKVTFENMWVDPGYRRRGVARSLMHQAFLTLKERGYTYCALPAVDVENQPARRLFAEFGGFNFGKHMCWIDRNLA